MSWIVQSILINRFKIREIYFRETDASMRSKGKATSPNHVIATTRLHEEFNPYMNAYDDLLTVEKRVEELFSDGTLEKFELELLNNVIETNSFTVSAKNMDLTRLTVAGHFRRICEKISYYLGGQFTDEGYVEHLREKHDLNENQIERMVDFMMSEYKHKIAKGYKGETSE